MRFIILFLSLFLVNTAMAEITDIKTNERFHIPAGTWGGIVRAGPGMNYQKIASLEEGEAVTLLRKSSVIFNRYPWFVIRFDNGRIGYQWGGILCATTQMVEGIFQKCR